MHKEAYVKTEPKLEIAGQTSHRINKAISVMERTEHLNMNK